jgi:diguanylate cyclase (GGDEF)-like protein/PAS domain S-box-containing protein
MKNEFYENLLNNLYDGVYFVDTSRIVTIWNKGAERISGYLADEVIGKGCFDNILRHIDEQGTQLCVNGCPLHKTLTDGKIRESNIYLHHKLGHRVPVSVRVSPIYDDQKKIIGAVEIFSDNSNRLSILEELEKIKKEAYIDSLTKIANRKFIEISLKRSFDSFKNYKVPFGIIFYDIDHFKKFNDTYGHNLGDQVLTMTAKSSSNAIRVMDTLGCWGGEEFIIIAPNINQQALISITKRLKILIENSWITHENENLKVTVSIGATLAYKNDTFESIIERADQMMYKSKKAGRNTFTIHE